MVGPLSVLNHYDTADLMERVDQALKQAGLDNGSLTWPDLAPLDQFHVRGLAATKELADGLGLEAGTTVIDVGCGLGGPVLSGRDTWVPGYRDRSQSSFH